MSRKITHSFSLRPETLRRVKALAELHGEKISTIADLLLCDALDQAEAVAAATTNPVVMAAVTRAMSEPGVLRSMVDVMRSSLSDDQLALFTTPAVELRPNVLRREGVKLAGATPRPRKQKRRR
jgi:uncharacterized protein (DUF362 family)